MLPHAPTSPSALRGVLAALCIVGVVSAQTVTPDEPVKLSPFEVSADTGSGYATSSSLTVSRVAAPITEIPVSAEIINEKMIEDTLAVTAEDTFNLVSGLYHGNAGAGNQESNDFSMRGYVQSVAQRDGVDDSMFNSAGGFDYSFIQRIEVVKGPNGILYGSTSPGGVINLISKRPLPQPMTKFSMMTGSFGFYRTELDTSQFLDKGHQWGIRVAGAISNTRGPLDWNGDPKLGFRGINPSLSFRSKSGIDVWFWSAFVRDDSSRAKFLTRAFADNPAPGKGSLVGGTGAPLMNDRTFIDGGGAQNLLHSYAQLNTNSYELGSSKSFELGPITLDARVLGRYRSQLNDFSRVRATGNDIFLNAQGSMIGPSTAIDNRFINITQVEPPGTIAAEYRNNIRYDYRPARYNSSTFDVDLNFTYVLGPVRSQTLLTGLDEKGKTVSINNTFDITDPTTLQSLGYPIVGGVARVYLYPKPQINFNISRETVLKLHNTQTLNGSSISDIALNHYGFLERLSFWDGRVVIMGGATKYNVNNRTSSVATTGVVNPATPAIDKQWTPGFGAVVKLYKGSAGEFVAFADLNRTFSPVYTLDQRLATFGRKFPDLNAQANEFGVKADLLHSRVVLTSSYFGTNEDNVLLSYVDDNNGTVTGTPDKSYSAPGGTRISHGFEEDLNVKITSSLEAVVSYGLIHSVVAATQLPAEAMPFHTASALLHYRIKDGWAQGLSLTYAYNHWGKSLLGGSRTTWQIPGGNIHTAILAYNWTRYTVQLRVQNLFDVRDPQPSSFDTGVGVTNPRNYRVGFTAKF